MDRASDELIQQILAAASKLAPQRVERLVQEATCEAEQEVRALVKSAMKAAMLRQVAEQLQNGPAAPATPVTASDEPSEIATGCYVYCITHANHSGRRTRHFGKFVTTVWRQRSPTWNWKHFVERSTPSVISPGWRKKSPITTT